MTHHIEAVGFLPESNTLVGLSNSAKLWYWRTTSSAVIATAEAAGLK